MFAVPARIGFGLNMFTNGRHHIPAYTHAGAGCFKVGASRGGFPAKEPAALNHMSEERWKFWVQIWTLG